MPILTITAAEVAQIARLDPDDSQAAADVAGVLANEQSAVEQTLDPAAFRMAGVGDLLRRNVAKLLAAEVLEMRAREEGASGDVQVGSGASGVRVSGVPDFAASLRAEASAVLANYRRREPILGRSGPQTTLIPASGTLTGRVVQDRLYGRTEQDRLSNERRER